MPNLTIVSKLASYVKWWNCLFYVMPIFRCNVEKEGIIYLTYNTTSSATSPITLELLILRLRK